MEELLFFTGKHCATCKSVKARIDARLSQNKVGSKPSVREISIDEAKGMMEAAKLSVNSLPTVIKVQDGKPMKTYIGSSIVNNLINEGLI